MKMLVVYSHPNPASFNNAIKSEVIETARSLGHQVVVRDLYDIQFDPILKGQDFANLQNGSPTADISTEQDFIRWADVITFIYPIWWTGLPAMLKGYIDRVFSFGFAYTVTENGIAGLLTDKKVAVINTTGTPDEIYQSNGMTDAMNKTSDTGIFEFSGMKVISHTYFGGVPNVTDEDRKAMLETVKKQVSLIK